MANTLNAPCEGSDASVEMELVYSIASVLVMLAGLWLIGLALVALIKPDSARQFLGSFASSAATHFLEMFLRIVVGAAMIVNSERMLFPMVFYVFGWMLLATSAVLIFVPWKVHKRFAGWSLPMATARMNLFGIVSLIGGVAILFAFFLGG